MKIEHEEKIKLISKMISKSKVEKRFFLKGGCSKLVEYFFPKLIKINKKIKIACFISCLEENKRKQLNDSLTKFSDEELNEAISKHEIIIDHIAIINKNSILDGFGCNDINFYKENIMSKNCFLFCLTFDEKVNVENFLHVVFDTHVFGYYSKQAIYSKIRKLLLRNNCLL